MKTRHYLQRKENTGIKNEPAHLEVFSSIGVSPQDV